MSMSLGYPVLCCGGNALKRQEYTMLQFMLTLTKKFCIFIMGSLSRIQWWVFYSPNKRSIIRKAFPIFDPSIIKKTTITPTILCFMIVMNYSFRNIGTQYLLCFTCPGYFQFLGKCDISSCSSVSECIRNDASELFRYLSKTKSVRTPGRMYSFM